MRYKVFLLILLSMVLSSCYTIHFVRDAGSSTYNYSFSKWHHIGLWGLVEFSKPVNLSSYCRGGNWSAVRTQVGFVQGLVAVLINGLPGFVVSSNWNTIGSRLSSDVLLGDTFTSLNYTTSSAFFSNLYTPEEVNIACRQRRR